MRWFGPGTYWESAEAVLRARWYLRNATYVGARVRV
jgi:hypothetical protein